MHLTPLILLTLFFTLIVTGCCSTPDANVTSKGQLITRCLDNYSPEQCDKKYNP